MVAALFSDFLGTNQFTHCGGLAWRKLCKQNIFCVRVVWQTQCIQHLVQTKNSDFLKYLFQGYILYTYNMCTRVHTLYVCRKKSSRKCASNSKTLRSRVSWCVTATLTSCAQFKIFLFLWFARYVLQLAIADTLFLLTLPFKASQKINNGWIYSDGLCKAQESFLYINYYASILFLMVSTASIY